jgi:hypothetical protein
VGFNQKSANMTQKPFLTKFEYGYQSNPEFYADFKTVEKNAKNLLTKKLFPNKSAKLERVLFY